MTCHALIITFNEKKSRAKFILFRISIRNIVWKYLNVLLIRERKFQKVSVFKLIDIQRLLIPTHHLILEYQISSADEHVCTMESFLPTWSFISIRAVDKIEHSLTEKGNNI